MRRGRKRGKTMSAKARKIWKTTVKIFWYVVWALLCILALLVLWMAFDKFVLGNPVPSVFGYSTLNIATGSMNGTSALVRDGEPKQVSIGDLIVIKKTNDYKIGDVITFMMDGDTTPTTHRIVGITEQGFITKGDANNTQDVSPVPVENVLGAVVGHYPKLGQFTMWIKAEGWIYAVALLTILALGGFLIKYAEEPQLESANDTTTATVVDTPSTDTENITDDTDNATVDTPTDDVTNQQ